MKNLIKKILVVGLFALSSVAFAGPVNINIADAPTLAANIKGVGVKKAEAIVAYRDTHGSFSRVEELSKVRGIGLKKVEKNRENLKVE